MDPVSARSEPAADRWLFFAFLVLLVWLPLPLGSNRIWAWSLMEVWVFALSLCWLIQYARGRSDVGRAFVRAWPAALLLFATALWVFVQTLPLPTLLLGLLSPKALDVHNLTLSFPSLSLDVFATRHSALKTLSYLLLFCLTLLLTNNRRRVRVLAQVIVLSAVFQASYGALMTLSGLEYGFFFEKEDYRGVATGTFVNRNHLAGYLQMGLAVGIGLMISELPTRATANWRESLRRFLKTLLGSKARIRLALVIMVIGLVLTHSRMGNAAFLVSLSIVGTYYLIVVSRNTRAGVVFFASILIIDLMVVANFFGVEEVVQRLEETSLQAESRDEVARNTLRIVGDFPLSGSGAGSFYSTYPRYNSEDVMPGFYEHAHNDYLQFASEFGIPALVLLCLTVAISLRASVTAMVSRRDRLFIGMGFSATMAIISLLIHTMVDFNLQIPANAGTFVVILAIAWVSRHTNSVPRSNQ